MNPIKNQKAYIIHLTTDSRRVPPFRAILTEQGCVVRHQALITATATGEVERFQQNILLPQIHWADVLCILISITTKDNLVMTWAVQTALGLGKRVVGIWDEDEEDGQVPAILDDYANAVVPMNRELVLDAVGGGHDGVRGPDGKSRTDRVIERHDC